MNADHAAELRDLVDNHLSRGGTSDVVLGTVCVALSTLGSAMARVQERDENWEIVLDELRRGMRDLRVALPMLDAERDGASLRAFAERQLRFAQILEAAIVRCLA